MFTRRTLFKMLAAIGSGSLLPTVVEGGVARLFGIGEALPFGSSVRPGGSLAKSAGQAIDVTAIERWESLLYVPDTSKRCIARHQGTLSVLPTWG